MQNQTCDTCKHWRQIPDVRKSDSRKWGACSLHDYDYVQRGDGNRTVKLYARHVTTFDYHCDKFTEVEPSLGYSGA